MGKTLFTATILLSFVLSALTRTEIIENGEPYTTVEWTATAANVSGSGSSCPTGYEPLFTAGNYVGMAYDWGGFDSVSTFTSHIASGYGAGSYSHSSLGTTAYNQVLACASGIDCSGFVSRAWGQTTKYGTSTISGISSNITQSSMKKGDAFNNAGSHIIMFVYEGADGRPYVMESTGGDYKRVVYRPITYTYVSAYQPIRYNSVQEDTSDISGTAENPISIEAFPFTDSNNTRKTVSLDFYAYNCSEVENSANLSESGPEIIYTFTVDRPGTISASVSGDTSVQYSKVDIDIHLLSDLIRDENDTAQNCITRNNTAIETHIESGTYYLIVDSYTSSNVEFAGSYTLSAAFTADALPETDEDIIPNDEENTDNEISDEDTEYLDETEIADEAYDDETIDSTEETDDDIVETADETNLPDENNTTKSQCTYKGLIFNENMKFPEGDKCNICTCMADGIVSCTQRNCENYTANDDDNSDKCIYKETVFDENMTFPQGDECNICYCHEEGEISCTMRNCEDYQGGEYIPKNLSHMVVTESGCGCSIVF